MHQSWTKEDKSKLSPNIGKMIQRSNVVPMWIATQILAHTEPKQKYRAKMIIHFIKIAKVCFSTPDFINCIGLIKNNRNVIDSIILML